MANLEQIVSQKAENDTRWKAQQQSERENTVALQDAGIMQITSSPEALSTFYHGRTILYISIFIPGALFYKKGEYHAVTQGKAQRGENKKERRESRRPGPARHFREAGGQALEG